MTALSEYIAGRGEALSRRELNRIIDRYGWFTTARRARMLVTGEPDPALILPLMFWATLPPRAKEDRHCEEQGDEAILSNGLDCSNDESDAAPVEGLRHGEDFILRHSPGDDNQPVLQNAVYHGIARHCALLCKK